MNPLDPDFDAAVEALLEKDYSERGVRLLADAVGRNEAWHLVESGLQSLKERGLNDDASTDGMHRLIESLADHDMVSALVLMAYLWSIAGELYMHHICDSIDLWMWHNMSVAVKPHLQLLIGNVKEERLKKHYTLWLNSEVSHVSSKD